MKTYLVCLQYQGDDRVEDQYRAYSEETDEDKVADMIVDLPDFASLEQDCIDNWSDEDDYPEDQYASIFVKDITNEPWATERDAWFSTLPILIDERK